jgi:hypothetical protein
MPLDLIWKRIIGCDARSQLATRACPLLLVIGLMGCSGKSAVSQLRDGTPPEAAAKVMELYDSDKDGKLVAVELAASPGLTEGLSRIDANKDGAVDLAEMTARFTALDDLSDVISMQVMVTANGTPLEGAVVTLTPDPCMGEGKQAYEGTTVNGSATPMGAVAPMPTPVGYYTLHVVHAATAVDLKRGHEVADDAPSPNRLAVDVSGKTPPAGRGR